MQFFHFLLAVFAGCQIRFRVARLAARIDLSRGYFEINAEAAEVSKLMAFNRGP